MCCCQDQADQQEKIEGLYVHLHEIRQVARGGTGWHRVAQGGKGWHRALLETSHDLAQVTGARCLADGNSAAALINLMNKEEREAGRGAGQEEEPSLDTDTDIARKDSVQKGDTSVQREWLNLCNICQNLWLKVKRRKIKSHRCHLQTRNINGKLLKQN